MLAEIPFYPQPILEIPGLGLRLYAFGMCVAAAILFGAWLAKRRTRRLGLDEDAMADLLYFVFGGGFVGAHLVDVLFYHRERLMEDPLLILKVWDGISSFGGFLGAAAGVLIFYRWRKLSRPAFWGYCEAIIFALPFGWVFGRLGCTLAHDHPGIESDAWFAIAAPPATAAGVPEGLSCGPFRWDFLPPPYPDGSFIDLGLLELVYTLGICALLLVLNRKRRPVGFYLTVIPIVYAPVRFGLDFLRAVDERYFGLTPGQYIAIFLVCLAPTLWWRRPRDVYGFGPNGQPIGPDAP